MTKRREQGHYNAADRFVLVADVNSAGVLHSIRTGTETFDHIWRIAKNHTTHLVLRSNTLIAEASGQLSTRWLVTSMFGVKMNDQSTIEMGPYKLFITEDAAIMYASMMASQGKETMDLLNFDFDAACWWRGIKHRKEITWCRIGE